MWYIKGYMGILLMARLTEHTTMIIGYVSYDEIKALGLDLSTQ